MIVPYQASSITTFTSGWINTVFSRALSYLMTIAILTGGTALTYKLPSSLSLFQNRSAGLSSSLFGSQNSQAQALADRINILNGRQQMIERMYGNSSLWTNKKAQEYKSLSGQIRGLQFRRQLMSPNSKAVSSRVGGLQTSFESWKPGYLTTQ